MTRFAPLMDVALAEARAAARRGEIPVGAALAGPGGDLLARAGNRTRELSDPTAHAEILAIRAACAAARSERLPPGTTLHVTLEPCAMCAAAISAARVAQVVYSAADPKSGGVEHGARLLPPQTHHKPEIVAGVRETECAEILRAFFAGRRD